MVSHPDRGPQADVRPGSPLPRPRPFAAAHGRERDAGRTSLGHLSAMGPSDRTARGCWHHGRRSAGTTGLTLDRDVRRRARSPPLLLPQPGHRGTFGSPSRGCDLSHVTGPAGDVDRRLTPQSCGPPSPAPLSEEGAPEHGSDPFPDVSHPLFQTYLIPCEIYLWRPPQRVPTRNTRETRLT